jgi:hypothetical protein
MSKKSNAKKVKDVKGPAPIDDSLVPKKILTSKVEVAEELKMSVYQFNKLLNKYPFGRSGVAGKISGRWRITQEDAWRWFRYVQTQESRHPDARRMRPAEPPAVAEIRTR